jgi:mono/diheme cytochrome c family protein
MSKALGTIALLLFLGGGTGGCAILDPNPEAVVAGPAPTDTSAGSGEELYLKHCVGCHGTNGVPLDTAVGELRNYSESYLALDTALNTGPGTMPIYPYAKLDSAQRRLIYDYILKFE